MERSWISYPPPHRPQPLPNYNQLQVLLLLLPIVTASSAATAALSILQIGRDFLSMCYVLWYDGKSHEAGASPTFPDERRGPRVAGLLQLSCRENFQGLQSAMRC